MKNIVFIIIILSAMNLYGCYDMNTLSVKPSTTTVTYGQDRSTGEKDAKNDVLTNNQKESWTIKQVFKWE
jgi:hypothetical protein